MYILLLFVYTNMNKITDTFINFSRIIKGMKQQKYEQVIDYIIHLIQDQNLSAGDKIPTEEELCKATGFSRMTVNKAIIQLVNQGIIERTRGKGSFIKTPSIRKSVSSHSSFSEDMKEHGITPGSQLLSYEMVSASSFPRVKEKMSLTDSDMLHHFIRLRTGNGTPIAISETWISASVIPIIPTEILNQSLYDYVDSTYKIKPSHMSLEFSAHSPDPFQCEHLKLNDLEVLLICSHVTYCSIDGREYPYEYIETSYNSQMYSYSIDIETL